MTLGEKIKEARLERRLSQSELAGDEITRNMLSAIESDKANPSLKTLSYLADRLSLPLSYLFAEKDDLLIQKKLSLISAIKNAFRDNEYEKCISLILGIGFIDDELALMLSTSYFNLGRAAVFSGSLKSAKQYLELTVKYADMTVYDTEGIRALSLMYSALADNIQAPLLNFDIKTFNDSIEREYDYDFYKYLLQDSSHKYKNSIYSSHLDAKNYIKQRKYSEAIHLLSQIENQKNSFSYNAYVILSVYTDLENCYKQLLDYEKAYRYASKRLSLLEAFKE